MATVVFNLSSGLGPHAGAALITLSATSSTSSPTANTGAAGDGAASSSSNSGAIAGGVVGGLAFLCLFGLGVFYLGRYAEKKMQNQVTGPPTAPGGANRRVNTITSQHTYQPTCRVVSALFSFRALWLQQDSSMEPAALSAAASAASAAAADAADANAFRGHRFGIGNRNFRDGSA